MKAYDIAKERYAELGVDTEKALSVLSCQSISLHCWQGDDVKGFENISVPSDMLVTGDHPVKARTVNELRSFIEKALSQIQGRHRVNLHAMYGEFGRKKIDRNQIGSEHFKGWIDWAKERGYGLDFNPTMFSHPKAKGFTLASKDKNIRKFWIEHVWLCREIGAEMGKQLNTPCIHNIWIPDGMKDQCIDKAGYRAILSESLDEIFEKRYSRRHIKESLESKLFGIGTESFVAGSHELYLGYALKHNLMLCLDLGHFHPTESIGDKISSILQFSPELLLHLSRGVRWDSDHVVLFDDQMRDVAHEVVRTNALDRVHLALDFFDGSLDPVKAWVIGAKSVQKSLLYALLEPTSLLKDLEEKGDYTGRLALLEELKSMPWGAVWEQFEKKTRL
jgi:L-rhamnose isomerase